MPVFNLGLGICMLGYLVINQGLPESKGAGQVSRDIWKWLGSVRSGGNYLGTRHVICGRGFKPPFSVSCVMAPWVAGSSSRTQTDGRP